MERDDDDSTSGGTDCAGSTFLSAILALIGGCRSSFLGRIRRRTVEYSLG